MKKNLPFVLSLCFAALAPAGLKAQTAGLYPVNYDESQHISHASRYTNSVTLASQDNSQQTVAVNQGVGGLLYLKRLDDCLMAKAGETVTAGFAVGYMNWMCGYAYIDLDNNGQFDVDYDDNGVNAMKELMTYSMYKDKNSNGAAVSGEPSYNPPAFVIPADTKPGIYRMRYKIDWDNVDPGGNNSSANPITKNGGVIVDTRINIHGENANISLDSDTEHGTATLADGSALNKAAVAFGKDATLKVAPEDGYSLSHFVVRHGYNLDGEQYVNENKQWEETTVNAKADDAGLCTLSGSVLDGDVTVKPVFAKVTSEVGEQGYGLSFDKDANVPATSSYKLNGLTVANGGIDTEINVAEMNTVYRDATAKTVAAKAGDALKVTVDSNSPFDAYLYIDYDNDGRFRSEMNEDGAVTQNSELVSFSCLNGKNSAGEASTGESNDLPAFTLPENLPAGNYRARLKIDNNSAASAGSEGFAKIGGFMVDFLINVHEDNAALDVNGVGGNMVGADNTGVAATVAYGTPLNLMPLAPAKGYNVQRVVVRHGHNLKGAQYDANGNRQWDEYETSEAENDETFTVPADKVDGEVSVTAYFTADGTEEYKLVFADEFDGEDGSLPNAEYWHNSTREHPTWKRFTSQTPEGQARTAFLRDGKLVTRCIANDIAEEGDVEMISGAIESSDKVYYNYGRIEGRLRTTPHVGNFPAFWLMPQDNSAGWPNAGEIDLWEQIDTENKTYHTVHTHVTYDLGKAKPNSGSAYTNSADYHIISMDWEPTLLTWYVDGEKAFSYAKSTDQTLLDQGQWPFDKPFYIILNQSVGNNSWAKNCDVTFQYETLFDYVRIYQKDGQNITKPTTGIGGLTLGDNNAEARLDVYGMKGGMRIVAPEAQTVSIVDVAGRTVFCKTVQGNVDVKLAKGLYVVAGKKVLVD